MERGFLCPEGRGVKQKKGVTVVNTAMNMGENKDGLTTSNVQLELTDETSGAINNSEEDTNVSLAAKIQNDEKLILEANFCSWMTMKSQ
ncbi:hypothetical protein CTI12_AA470630 [Artemisia annua]|uniref:Uncharacterized protein n=1 Tax=Artemisia annua TaxID=35608 RepID=A0A2U1LNU1_ARTAN|nr:hypothetical protein CTI12_AA470630 [Artemisia annua]